MHGSLPATETSPRALIRYERAKWIQIWKDAILLTEASETFRHRHRDRCSFPAGFAKDMAAVSPSIALLPFFSPKHHIL
jgi:hypothetical protein